MIQTNERTMTAETRESLYLFLSRLYIQEADQEVIEAIRGLKFTVQEENELLSSGLELLAEAVKLCSPEILDDLAVDYASLFLAAGQADGKAAFPYESVYTSKARLLMQESQNQVKADYRRHQLIQGTGFPAVPEDHIAMELYFMAILCQEEIRVLEENDSERLAELKLEQLHFYQEHLCNWTVYFCEDIAKYAKTAFYQALGQITNGFMQWEGTYGLQNQSS